LHESRADRDRVEVWAEVGAAQGSQFAVAEAGEGGQKNERPEAGGYARGQITLSSRRRDPHRHLAALTVGLHPHDDRDLQIAVQPRQPRARFVFVVRQKR